MDDTSPYKVFSGGRPEKVFSGGMGTAKVFSSGGVALCMSGSSEEPTPGLYKPTGAGVYLLDPLPACKNGANGNANNSNNGQ